MRFKFINLLFLLLLLGSNVINSQVLGPELKARKFEIGIFHKYVHRKLNPEFSSGNDWAVYSLFMKYGINHWLTLSTGGIALSPKDSRHPNRKYRCYIIGVGITGRIFTIKGLKFNWAFHYNEIFAFDRLPYNELNTSSDHQNMRGTMVALQIERNFSIFGQSFNPWVGPIYVYDEFTYYPSSSFVTYTNKSFNNFGFVVGVNFTLFKRIEPFIHIVYADFLQHRWGIDYQF